jgi:DNA-binding transcriptional LysR family regulator
MLGQRLFARRGRGIVLTLAGQELQRHVERLLMLLAETTSVVHEIHSLERGSIVVGASTSAGTYVVPSLLGAFHAHHPGIRITLTVANRRSIEELLLTHQVDLVVMSLIEQRDRFVVEFLMPYELVVVAPLSHRLVGCSGLLPDDLLEETFLMREQGAGTRLDTEQHFAQVGVSIQTRLELGSIEAIKEGVIAGLGIAVLARESVALEVANGDLAILDVMGFPLEREWHVVHLKGRRLSLAAEALHQFLLPGTVRSQ